MYEPRAILRERIVTELRDEYAMRVRVALRAFWALYDMRHLLNPFRYGMYSWQLFSHKVLRYVAFAPLGCALAFNALLWSSGTIYQALLVAQLAFYALACLGYTAAFGSQHLVPLRLPQYFVLLNVACAHAFVKFLGGKKQTVWRPRTG